MTEPIDIEQHIAALVMETLGETPRGMERMAYGHCNAVYDVALAGRNVIVRTNTQPHVLAGTERTMAILAALGLPLPRILAADVSAVRYPFAYL
ncbi:MAG TPA: hypothetical protein VKT52_08615, partial [Ktedonobacterales bacterium]|nr:hypothetical protein [Ktedonobacterales bacterium]